MRDAALALLLLLLVLSVSLLWVACRMLKRCTKATQTLETEMRALRLKSRARISTLSISPTDPRTQEIKTLQRLGRRSDAKRIVVGGEAESALNKDLERRWHSGRDDD